MSEHTFTTLGWQAMKLVKRIRDDRALVAREETRSVLPERAGPEGPAVREETPKEGTVRDDRENAANLEARHDRRAI